MADGWKLDPLPPTGWTLDPTPEEKQWSLDPMEGFHTPAPGPLASEVQGKSQSQTAAETELGNSARDIAADVVGAPSGDGLTPLEHVGRYYGDTARGAATGAVSVVGMGLRGFGREAQRMQAVIGSTVFGGDQGKAQEFLSHWLAPAANQVFGGSGLLLDPGAAKGLTGAGEAVQGVGDSIAPPQERQNTNSYIIANATGQVAGMIALSMVGGESAVDSAILGQSFDQIDQSLKEKGVKDDSVAGLAAVTAGGPVMGALERTGLDVILEGVPLKVKGRIMRGLADVAISGGFEASEEVAQQIVQNFAVKLGVDPSTPVRDWSKDLGEGIVPNAIGGGGAGAIVRAIAGRWGAHAHATPQPMGMREGGALGADITPEDQASPLPTDLIVEGKMTMGAAEGTTKANQALQSVGMPGVGTRVSVTHNGRTQQGAVADAWTLDVAGQSSTGIKIRLDDGTMIEEPLGTLHDMGVSIKPEQVPEGLPASDITDPVVRQYAAEGMETVRAAGNATYAPPPQPEPVAVKPAEKASGAAHGANLPQDVVQGLVRAGIPEHVARGAAAGVSAEANGGSETALNATSGAFGLGQWLGSRKDELIRRYGPDPTRAQQIEFLAWELKGGDAGGKSVLAAKDEEDALNRYIKDFMRPAKGAETSGDLDRGHAALGTKPGTQGDLLGGPQRTGTEMDARRAVDAFARDENADTPVDTTDAIDTAHAVLTSEAEGDERHVEYHGQQLGSMLGTTVTAAEAPDYARAVLERFGDQTHGHAVAGAQIDDEHTAFAEHTGTLAIPRAEMPQIKAEHRGAMVNFLNARDVSHEEETVAAHALKPSQAEFSPDKVKQAKEFTGGDRAILIDKNNHIVDGHHQYVAAHDRGQSVRAIRLNSTVQEISKYLVDMPSAETAAASATKPAAPTYHLHLNTELEQHGVTQPMLDAMRAEGYPAPRIGELGTLEGPSGGAQFIRGWNTAKGGFPREATDNKHQVAGWDAYKRAATETEKPAETSTGVRIEDTPSGKGIAVYGTSVEQRRAIDSAIGEKKGIRARDGIFVYSKKHEAKIRDALKRAEQEHQTARERGTGGHNAGVAAMVALNTPSKQDQLKASQAAKKANEKAGKRLRDWSGVEVPDYSEQGKRGDYDGGPTKDAFLKDGRDYLKAVGDILQERGFTPPLDRKGKPKKAVHINEGGPAVAGDVYLDLERPDGSGFLAQFGMGFSKGQGAQIRAVSRFKGARDGTNRYLDASSPAGVMADMLEQVADEQKHTAPAEERPPTTSQAAAEARGAQAFADGATRVPPGTEHLQAAWLKGWDRANLAAPVPEEKPAPAPAPTSVSQLPTVEKSVANRPGYGESNKIITREKADIARAIIRDKLKNQLNSGFDPELMSAGLTIAAFHVEAGARKFADFVKAVSEDIGVAVEDLKPYLFAWYSGTRAMFDGLDMDVADMDEPATVRAALAKIGESGKEQPDAGQSAALERPEGPEPATVQPTEQERGAGRVGPGEAQPGQRDLQPSDRGSGQAAERSGEGPKPESGSRGASARSGDGRPDGRGAAGSTAQNYVIRPGALEEARGPKQKARDNLEAIRIVKRLAADDRFATPEEQEQLARYVGWGGLKNVFPDGQGAYGKGFEDIGSELASLLTPDEYDTARRSIQYAHYTAERIVREMWRAVERLGFSEGQVFEPGMGTGNFPGMMPDTIRGAVQYQGLEFDGITAAIAKALYPKHGVTQADYTGYEVGKDAYRLAIGNPPFSETVVKADPEYRALGMVLHDYFFAKTLDAVQPGGALAFVTSTGTMNKLDTSAREYLAERAWLAGAVRLPGGAFAENAGTEVTTDIVFLVKKVPGEERPAWAAPDNWTETVNVRLPNKDGGTSEATVSRYFHDNPDQVLGEQGLFDRLWPGRLEVRSDGRDVGKALAEAIDRLPDGVLRNSARQADVHTNTDFDVHEAKNGSYYLKDGKLYQKQGGLGREVATKGKGSKTGLAEPAQAIVRDLIPIRDGLRDVYKYDLMASQAKGSQLELAKNAAGEYRKALNAAYDAFVAKHGPINKGLFSARRPNRVQIESARRRAREEARAQGHEWDDGTFDPSDLYDSGASIADVARIRAEMRESYAAQGQPWSDGSFSDEEVPDTIIEKRPNIDPFREDPENYRLRSIEHYDDETGTAKKGRVFFESVIAREEEPDIKNATDALFHVLNKSGRVDLDEIAHLAGTSPADAAADLAGQIFLNPDTQAWEHSTVYLSGNVRQKLAKAREMVRADERYQSNAAALEAVMPPELGKSEVRAVLGMPWIAETDIQQFATDELGLAAFHASYQPRLASWAVSGDKHSAAAASTFGTNRRSAVELMGDGLNGATPKIFDTYRDADGTTHSVLNSQETQAAQDKLAEIKQRFEDWLFKDDDRAERLLKVYNERFNSFVAPEWDGSYLTTPGVTSSWTWRPHQLRGIARIVQSGNTYLGHAVGAGKTATMIAGAMEMKRLGLVNKPMVSVPNHMLGQFTKEWYELYPLARLAIADEENFHTDKRKQFVSDVALNDLDGVVITHSAFGLIPMSAQFEQRFLRDQLADLRDILSEVKASDEDGQTKNITRRKVEQQIEQMEQRLRAITTRRRDQTFTFEQLGVDFLNVDEAHLFRKLDFATKRGNIKGIDPNGSMRSMDLYMKTRYLEQRRPGRSHVLASGTAITNTMAELYTISRYLQPHELVARGVDRFDAWAASFGNTKSDLEPTAGGTYKMQTRFSEFVNVPELSVMVRQIMDVVTSSQLEQYVVRPKVHRELILVPQTPGQSRYQEQLARRMKAIEERTSKPKKGDDIILTVIGDGRKSSIDMRLVHPGAIPEPTKLERLIDNAHQVWAETKRHPFYEIKPDGYSAQPASHGRATQMIFSSLGVSDAMEFNVHRYIRDALAKRGVPKDQIVLFNQVKSTVAKQKVFNDMNAGKISFLIGSVEKMGTGVNAQRRLYANHNLDPEWLPSSDEQRNGRLVRQGNTNREVRIFDYGTKGTYDEQMWGIMARKARFIEGFFRGDPTLRTIEDLGEASTYEQAKALIAKDPRILELAGAKLELEKEIRRRNAHDQEQATAKRKVVYLKSEADAERARLELEEADAAKIESIKGDAFTATVNGKSFDDRQEFQEALDAARKSDSLKRGINRVGKIGGFELAVLVSDEERTEFSKGDGVAERKTVRTADPALLLSRDPDQVEARYVHLSASNTAVSAQATLEKLSRRPESSRTRIAQLEKSRAEFEDRANNIKEYAGLPKLRELQATVDRITSALQRENEKASAKAQPEPKAQAAPPGRQQLEISPADVDRIRARLLQRMSELGISDRVSLEAANGLRLARSDSLGQYDAYWRLISIALDRTESPEHSLNHETVHALRDLGLLTPDEWTVITEAAWSDARLRKWAQATPSYQELSLEQQKEEAAAEYFADAVDAMRGKSDQGVPLTAFQGMLYRTAYRIGRFLNALRHAVSFLRTGKAGDTRPIDVVLRIDRGKVGKREPMVRGRTPVVKFGRKLTERKLREQAGFHGTPHDFDEFSTDYIGKGEGAQAYGWGLYFASSKAVAEHYKKALSGHLPNVVRWNGKGFDQVRKAYGDGQWTEEQWDSLEAMSAVERAGSVKKALSNLAERKGSVYKYEGALDWLKAHGNEIEVSTPGRLFTVDLPESDELMDWDKPFSEQPARVKVALHNLPEVSPYTVGDNKDGTYSVLFQGKANEVLRPYATQERAQKIVDSFNADFQKGTYPKGKDIYGELARRLADTSKDTPEGNGWQVATPTYRADDRAASAMLKELGIPGHRYLDGMSRSKGDGHHNYVIYDDSRVKVVAKAQAAAPPPPEGGGLFAPGVEERWQDAAKGIGDGPGMLTRMSLAASRIGLALSRHWINLPNVPKYAELQQELRKLEAAPSAAKERAVRHLKGVLTGLTRADMDLFARKVVTDDLAWEAEQDRDLPFGFTPETLADARRAIETELEGKPAVVEAVRKRKALNRTIASELVSAGVLDAERLKNPSYYRHVVLDYARAEAAAARLPGANKKLRSPRWARRMGSEKDINANYLEAEFDWLAKALVDIPTAKAISWIGDSSHNILPPLREQAKAHNKAVLDKMLEDEKEAFEKGERDDMPLSDTLKGFRQRIAMGFKFIEDALETSHIDIPPSLMSSYNALGGGKGDPFPFLAWLLDNNQPGANGAAVVLKAISQRRVFTAKVLGRNHIDPTDAEGLVKKLAPEGYSTWSPDDARLLFTVKTMPEHAIDAMLEKIDSAPGVSGDDVRAMLESVRSALAFGGMRYAMILPDEVSSTLNALRREDTRGLIDAVAEVPLRWWKRWVLINPRRVIKYNLNNLSGDLDAVIAGSPKALRYTGPAALELAKVMGRHAEPSARYEEAVERGVFDSGLSIQEIPDINRLSAFASLTEGSSLRPDKVGMRVLSKAWAALQGSTQWRENVLRYAAYLDFVNRLESGEAQASIGYGASLPQMIDAVNDPRDRAALLARDLLGDYAAVSHAGQEIRRKLIPFWSWMEINTKRYWRLSSNALSQGPVKGFATAGGLGAAMGLRTTLWLSIRMGFLFALFQVWNHLLWPDEEKDLGEQQRRQLHVIVGRAEDGSIQTLRLQGAFSDALSWFGLSDAADAWRDYELGRGPLYDVPLAPVKATVNRIGTSLSPLFTVPFETISGKKLFPDLFATRFIRDKWRNAFQTFSLENEYDWLLGKPSRGYAKSWEQGVVYSRDPGELAYSSARGIAYDWLRRTKGQSDGGEFSSYRADALYAWRAARKFGDKAAEEKALDRLIELGVSDKDLQQSIKRADPLGPIAKKDRKAFLGSLTDDELATFEKADAWYRQRFLEGPAQ